MLSTMHLHNEDFPIFRSLLLYNNLPQTENHDPFIMVMGSVSGGSWEQQSRQLVSVPPCLGPLPGSLPRRLG